MHHDVEGSVSAVAQSDVAELGIATSGRALEHTLLSPRRGGIDAGSSASLPSFFVTTGILFWPSRAPACTWHTNRQDDTRMHAHKKRFLIKRKSPRPGN